MRAMTPHTLAFLDRQVTVEAPASIEGDVVAFFRLCAGNPAHPAGRRVVITEGSSGRYTLAAGSGPPVEGLARGEVIQRLATTIGRDAFLDGPGVALRAAAVGWAEKALLILGADGGGKSSLAAWFIEKGFAYLADDTIVLPAAPGTIAGFPGPLAFKPETLSHVAGLPAFHAASSVRAESRLLVCPERTWLATDPTAPCGLIIDVRFEAGADLRMEPIPPAQATLRVLEQTRTVVIPGDPDYAPVAAVGENAPALKLTYGAYAQIDGVLDFLARVAVETETAPDEFARFLRGLPSSKPPEKKTYPIPARSERKFSPKLTIGMATYDDFDGVYFTIQAIRMYHPEILDQVEFVVVDNHPDGPAGEALKDFEEFIPNYRYIPVNDTYGNAVKGRVFDEAAGKFVLCIDCHVLIVPGALRRLLEYFNRNPMTRDLLQGPVIHDALGAIYTHYEPKWTGGFYGTWGHNPAADDPNGEPFDIVMQNTGLFACRRAAWPGFNSQFRGFVAEEGYLHQKFRRAGGRTLCLPFLRCVHRFRRIQAVPYPMTWDDRIRNHIIGLRELGLPNEEMVAHFRALLGEESADALIEAAMREVGEMQGAE